MMRVCIIGNSNRLTILEENLKAKGFQVNKFRFAEELPEKIDAEIVVLPIPTFKKDGRLNLEGENEISAENILSKISENSAVISCGFKTEVRKNFDLNSREDFAYLNAVPTAEGAIFYALKNTERSLFESRVLITGFGRVAKILADRLKGLSPNITIAARSDKDLSYAKALGFSTVKISELADYVFDFDLIFQTVPVIILDKKIIDRIKKTTTIVELSSKSAGTDFDYAEKCGINVVHAPALPEKISPITAGNILTESVLSIIAEIK